MCDWPLPSVTSRRTTVHDNNAVGIQHGRVVVVVVVSFSSELVVRACRLLLLPLDGLK